MLVGAAETADIVFRSTGQGEKGTEIFLLVIYLAYFLVFGGEKGIDWCNRKRLGGNSVAPEN
jgi:hypothetical protein